MGTVCTQLRGLHLSDLSYLCETQKYGHTRKAKYKRIAIIQVLKNYLVKILILDIFPDFLGMTENEFSTNLVRTV